MADRRRDLHFDVQEPSDTAAAAEALKFFNWAYSKGDKMAEALDYVPLPDTVVKQIETTWSTEIKGADGKPVFVAK